MTRKKRVGGKMDTRFVGPYVITKCLGKGIYSLIDPSQIIKKISGSHLKPYKDNSILNNTHVSQVKCTL